METELTKLGLVSKRLQPDVHIPTLQEVWEFAEERLLEVIVIAEKIRLKEAKAADVQRQLSLNASDSISQLTGEDIPVMYGIKAMATVLSVDMRKSSLRAMNISEKSTYVSMHTIIMTLGKVLTDLGGVVINYRGDGLIGAFDLTAKNDEDEYDFPTEKSLSKAARCAKALIECADDVLEPLCKRYKVHSDKFPITVGVGIDFNELVLTKMGLDRRFGGHEITALGTAMNHASKLSDGNGEIRVTNAVRQSFPKSKGGKSKWLFAHYRG